MAPSRKNEREALAWSLATVRSDARDPYDMLSAAEFLVALGHLDEADLGLERAEKLLAARGVKAVATISGLSEVSRSFRRASLHLRVADLGTLGDRLMSPNEVSVLSVAPGARTLLIVFGSMYGNLWVSYPVLHCLLPSAAVSILYLKDPSDMMFLAGLPALGRGFEAFCAGIRATAARHAIADIRIVGFSSGGYAGLLAAMRIRASAFLGLSMRTDLAPKSALPSDRYVNRPTLRQTVGNLMFDLKPLLSASAFPRRGTIYYGADAEIDAAHGRHLIGLPNFGVYEMTATRHNSVVKLIAAGMFDNVIKDLLT
jgi:hypothetical protein